MTNTAALKAIQSGEALPDNLMVKGPLDLSGYKELSALPDNLTVRGWLDLSDCTGLRCLPEKLTVTDQIFLRGCTRISALPDSLRVLGWVDLTDCKGLLSLPDDFTVNGWLYLSGCTGLRSLPENLAVEGWIYLSNCSGLKALPDKLDRQTPLVENLDSRILEAIDAGGVLDMDVWHTSETQHDRAGWAVHLAGEAGYKLQERYGPSGAGGMIYLKSAGYIPDFNAETADALADIKRRVRRSRGISAS